MFCGIIEFKIRSSRAARTAGNVSNQRDLATMPHDTTPLEGFHSNTAEEWRDIPNYEGLYQVSDQGRVKRLETAKVLKPSRDGKGAGYYFVVLSKHGKTRQITIHRLVAWAFIGPQGDHEVNHKNGNKIDNRLENLEYVTHQQNVQHAVETGLLRQPRGEMSKIAKLTDDDVWGIKMTYALMGDVVTIKELADIAGVSPSTVSNIIAGRRRQEIVVCP